MAAIRSIREVFKKSFSWRPETRPQSEDKPRQRDNDSPKPTRANSENFTFGNIRMEKLNEESSDEDVSNDNQVNEMDNISSFLNTQTKGNVMNIINSTQVHCGPVNIVYCGTNQHSQFSEQWAANAYAPWNFNADVQNSGRTKRNSHKRQQSYTSQSSQSSTESARRAENARGHQRDNKSTKQSNTNSSESSSYEGTRASERARAFRQQSRRESNTSTPHEVGCGPSTTSQQDDELSLEITIDIQALMDSKVEPTHKYLRHISMNLGEDWKDFYILLGYKYKFIQTFEIDALRAGYGVREARYQLLLDWIGTDDVATLGLLTTTLWKAGERYIVRELAEIYNSDTEKTEKL